METTPSQDGETEHALPGGMFASLQLGQFRLLMGGTASAQVANWMDQVARGWLVHDLTGSPFHLGLIPFVNGMTSLIASPLAGVMVDRLDRRVLAGGSQMTSALIAILIGLLVALDRVELWHLYATAVITGLTVAVNMPARQVLLYDVVGTNYLTNAIALNSVVSNVARIAAPTVGGSIITAGIDKTYYVEATFLLIATMATFSLQPRTVTHPVRTPMVQGLREGFDFVRADPILLRLVLLNVVPSLLIYPYLAMFPIFAEDILGVGPTGYGLLISAVGFGSIPGGLIVANMSSSAYKGRVMGSAALLYMAMVALFAVSEWFEVSFALLVVGGVGWSMMAILNQTLLQLQLSDDTLRGRVIALYSMSNGVTPLGSLALGATANGLGVQPAVAGFAMIGLAAAAYLGLGSRRMREL
jgi:predicted MFS family arabinose efflux permease